MPQVGCVQFQDLNPEATSFQRQFTADVKRCEEIERRLRFFEAEVVKEGIEIPEPDQVSPLSYPCPTLETGNSYRSLNTLCKLNLRRTRKTSYNYSFKNKTPQPYQPNQRLTFFQINALD